MCRIAWGFSDRSVGKESACSAGEPGSIPRSGKSPGEGLGYLLQYSWASLVAQLVENLPAMQETWVRSLHWQDHLEKGLATHSSILSWRIPSGHKGSAKLSDFHFQYSLKSRTLIPPALFSFSRLLCLFRLFGISIKIVHFFCSNSVKKAECQKIDTFELWCCRRLLRVPGTSRDPISPS